MKTLNRTKKLNFDDQLSLLMFGCHATALGKNMFGVVCRSEVNLTARECLMPLGDDKGIELYGLREEIMTGHDKEAV
ncbi:MULTISPECIES: hypothetical protein [Acinetobacter calcoaceticus/baumannii complex]|uniref:hypothetical protein n=1 Tax=Acinetobacter calcoaceticus/baumannii complex TaxID=909768 RepID=UPI0004487765|nr:MULTISPECIES: hypothetical protein [Acinetobacter calcoaceticus/baumannii complex]EXI19291.1 hypothetical protein J610_0469 [Acinetobacter sp. 723929]MCK0789623.1 hypothetical protein [Acinetobacter pittii]MCK0794769.1 hypothetical protein [Acinetobacter pittii]MCK0801754.1 hypothetical protein [Acinetobacter pittii]MCK0890465.1 hypothetical protein [Acinetobacter pittii]